MGNKVVGFTIEIKGQKEIKTTADLLKLVNVQLVDISSNLAKINKQGGVGFKNLQKEFKTTGSSSKKLGDIVKKSFDSFDKGNKVVSELGDEYTKITKQVKKTGKEIKELDEAFKVDGDTIQDLIEDNKEYRKIIRLGTSATGEQSDAVQKMSKEYFENQKAIKKHNTEQRTGIKVSKASFGSINQMKAKVIELTKSFDALSPAQRDALIGPGAKIRKELAATTKRIQRLKEATNNGRFSIGLYSKAQKGLTKTLLKLSVGRSVAEGVANGLRNMFNGLKELATGSEEARERFADLNSAGGRLVSTAKDIGNRFLETFGGGVTDLMDSVSFSASVIGDSFFEASQGTGIFASVLQGLGSVLTDFPAIIGGVAETFGALIAPFTELSLSVDKVVISIAKAGRELVGLDVSDLEKRLADVNTQLAENEAFGRSIGEAYKEGFENTKAAQEEFIKNADEQVVLEAKLLEARKRTDKAKAAADAAEKKRIADLKKDRDSLLITIKTQAEARVQIAITLDKQLRDLQISAIQDDTERLKAAEKERFDLQKQARKKGFDDLVDEAAKNEAETARLFGVNSQELAALQEKNGNDLLLIQAQVNALGEAQEQAHQDKLLQITKDGESTRVAAETKALEATIARRKDARERLRAIREKRIATEKSDEEKANEVRKQKVKQTIADITTLVNVSFQAISDISQIAFDAENARFDDAIEKRQANISKLNEDLQSATGLQKKFLLQQVEQEQAALDAETEAKEKARKEQGEAQKAIALVQAGIAVALGIANAFTIPPPASFIAAAATAVAGLAQVAVIATSKFAKGGVLSGPSHAQGGISTPFGEMEGGEGVINKNSMANPKLRAVASAVNVAGGGVSFATGGITGAPISAPQIGNPNSDVNEKFNQFVDVSMAMAIATNNRIDNLSVSLDLNNLEDQVGNEANLEAAATFTE
jgi:hypothetical protein